MEGITIGVHMTHSGFGALDQLSQGLRDSAHAMSEALKAAEGAGVQYNDTAAGLAATNAQIFKFMEMTASQRVTIGDLTNDQAMLNEELKEYNLINQIAAEMGRTEAGRGSDEYSIFLAELKMETMKQLAEDEKWMNETIQEGLAIKEADASVEQKLINLQFQRASMNEGFREIVGVTEQEVHANIMLESSISRVNIALNDNRGYYEELFATKEKARLETQMSNSLSLEQILALETLDAETKEHAVNQQILNDIYKEYYAIVRGGQTDLAAAMAMAKENIYQKYLSAEATKAETIAEDAHNAALGRKRQELMQLSIGMFVLGITTTQTLGAMAKMTEAVPALSETFTELQGATKMILGPLQMFYALQQMITMENKALLMSALPLMAAFGGIYLFLRAFNAESPIVRAGLGAMAAAMLVLSAGTWAQTTAMWALVKVQLAQIATNPLTALSTPLYIAAGVAAVIAGIAMATLGGGSKGQTSPDYMRPITETGLFYGHKGEVVGRVGAQQPSGGTRSMNVYITVQSGASLDRGMIPQLSREMQMAVASGNGV